MLEQFEAPLTIRLFRKHAPVNVLGPGRRAVIWVQGCSLGCHGCIVPESWPADAGEEEAITDLAAWVLSQLELDGVTYSGGEPFEQAGALTALTRILRANSSLDCIAFSGYRHKALVAGSYWQKQLLLELDLLIDGTYQRRKHADLLWRGSGNQRLIPLSERFRDQIEGLSDETDRSAGLEFNVDTQGCLAFSGVPQQHFRESFEKRLAVKGIQIGTASPILEAPLTQTTERRRIP